MISGQNEDINYNLWVWGKTKLFKITTSSEVFPRSDGRINFRFNKHSSSERKKKGFHSKKGNIDLIFTGILIWIVYLSTRLDPIANCIIFILIQILLQFERKKTNSLTFLHYVSLKECGIIYYAVQFYNYFWYIITFF